MTTFKLPETVRKASYSSPRKGGLFIDASTANVGYVTAGYIGDNPTYNRLKFQVRCGDGEYNYDLGFEPTQFPVNMGNGSYIFRIMENCGGNMYQQVMSTRKAVRLRSAFVPYTVPNKYCNYSTDGPCARMAKYVCASCKTEGEAFDAIVKWVAKYMKYDSDKERELSKSKGYVPNPDRSFKERKGICFDYASMTAAMLRSVSIPCKVVTGYINGSTYHSWVLAHVDGSWKRRDPTFESTAKRESDKRASSYKTRFEY